MLDDVGNPLEDNFLDLVEYAPIPSAFHRGAKLMLGDNYKELGAQIVKEHQPKLMKKFESYFDANEETT